MRKQIFATFDDHDGQPIPEGQVVCRKLTLDGVPYSIDLREETSRLLDEAIAAFLPDGTGFARVKPLKASGKRLHAVRASRPEPAKAAPVETIPVAVREPEAEVLDVPATVQVDADNDEWKCPECGRPTDGWRGLASHRWQAHQIKGAVPGVDPSKRLGNTTTPERLAFGELLTETREKRGLSQKDVAEKAKEFLDDGVVMNQPHVSQAERGIASTWTSRLEAIAKVLDLEVPDFPVVERTLAPSRPRLPTRRPIERGRAAEPTHPEPTAEKPLLMCEDPTCDYPGDTRSNVVKAHMRLKHGIGGKSSAQMYAEQQREAIKATILVNPLREADGRTEPEPEPVERATPLHTIVPGVNVVASPKALNGTKKANGNGVKPAPPKRELVARGPAMSFSDAAIDVDTKITELQDRYKDGLPVDVEISFLDAVLWMRGFNKDKAEEALRSPEWVEIAAESYSKGYCILRFHKADVISVLGLRDTRFPKVIAYYDAQSLNQAIEQVNHAGTVTRSVPAGLPRNVGDMLDWLRAAGAEVDHDDLSTATAETVTYKGQELGKVPVGPTTSKADVEVAYQRVVRKIAAINERELVDA